MASSRYNPSELGELQKNILKHCVLCEEKMETVSHIAKALGKLQESVQRSVDDLVKQYYFVKESESYGKKREILLTEKGAAAAISAGADFKQFDNYLKKWPTSSIAESLKYLGSIATNPEKRNFMLQKAMDYALKNKLFEQGYMKQMTEEEGKTFIRYIMVEYTKSLGPANNIKTAEQFLDRYGLEKNFLKNSLIQQKQAIDALLKKLDSSSHPYS